MLPSSASLNSMEMVQFGPKDTAEGATVKRLTQPDVAPKGSKTESSARRGSGTRAERCKNPAGRDREINRRINADGLLQRPILLILLQPGGVIGGISSRRAGTPLAGPS
jgi:hypothetical protein